MSYKRKTISLTLENYKFIEDLFYKLRLKDFTKTVNFIFETIRNNEELKDKVITELMRNWRDL